MIYIKCRNHYSRYEDEQPEKDDKFTRAPVIGKRERATLVAHNDPFAYIFAYSAL